MMSSYSHRGHAAHRGARTRILRSLAAVGTLAAIVLLSGFGRTAAAQAPVGLGTAASFAVLSGATVTNTGPSIISGNLGVSPGSAVTGFPPGLVILGTQHKADAVALDAQSDLTTAYNDAAGRTPVTKVSKDLGGQTLAPGVYGTASGLGLTGTVTLNGENNPNAVFIFQAGSTLITASDSTVALIDGAQPCNVFWQVGSSATLGTDTTFVGNVLALTSATVQTGTTVSGRVLARNGQVSLDDNVITLPSCTSTAPTTTTSPGGGSTTTTSPGGGSTTTTSPGGGSTTTTLLGSGGSTTTTSPGGGGSTTTTSPGGGTTTTSPGGGSTSTTLPGGSTSTTTPGGSTSTTTPVGITITTLVTPTTIPGNHTGEPWSGWPYWALAGVAGLFGLLSLELAIHIRRRRA
jgi:hypothetical protein